jgi:hypothetical protein
MKECLNCKKEYQPKRDSSKFCSTSCRVGWYQKHSKGKKKVTPTNMQELYTEMLALIKKANSEPSQPLFGVVSKDEPKWGQTQGPVKIRLKRPFLTLQALVNECQSMEEYEPLRKEIEEADHLSDREKAILLRKR